MKKIAVFLALLMALSAVPAWAMSCPIDQWINEKASSDSYGSKAVGLFFDGLHRIVTSPVELVVHPYNGAKEDNVRGFFIGLGKGLYHTVEDIGTGVINILAAPIPGVTGVRSKALCDFDGSKAAASA